jgi:hypothetical protein
VGRSGPGAGLHARAAEPDAVPDVRGAPQRADAAGEGLLRRAGRRRGRRRGRLLLRPRGWVRRPRRPRARARAAHHLPRGRAAAQALRCARHARRRVPGRRRRASRVRYGVPPLCSASVIISRSVAFFNVAGCSMPDNQAFRCVGKIRTSTLRIVLDSVYSCWKITSFVKFS